MPQPRLTLAAASILWLAAAPASHPQTAPEWGAYKAELAQRCPDKRLELMSPGELSGVVEDFTARDTEVEATALARAADVAHACATVEMGATCGNFANLRGLVATRRLQSFAAYACVHRGACREQSDCDEAPAPARSSAQPPKLDPK